MENPKWPTWPLGEGTRRNCTTLVYVKPLKEAVHATRHSTNTTVSVITYIQPRRDEEVRQVPFHKGFPWGYYTSNEFLEVRSNHTLACWKTTCKSYLNKSQDNYQLLQTIKKKKEKKSVQLNISSQTLKLKQKHSVCILEHVLRDLSSSSCSRHWSFWQSVSLQFPALQSYQNDYPFFNI